jgi:hypothetical protein
MTILGKNPWAAETHRVKPFLLRFLLAGFLFPVASPLFGQANPPLATPHFELYQPDRFSKRSIGVLGLPLGTFAVIEGTEHHTSKDWGSEDFVVGRINGKKVEGGLRIMTDWPSQLPDKRISGKRYVLHGYEKGKWEGQPDGLPREEPLGWTQQAGFSFQHIFAVTSVEKVDGVTVADARPLDPGVPLAQPDPTAKPDDVRPIGVLGLPLGTFAIIQAYTPPHPMLLESPFGVSQVNGIPLHNQPVLSIRGVPETKGNEIVTLHGYEAGEWESDPDLPKSENPSGTEAQQPFQFHHEFVVTCVAKSATPAQSHSGP